LRVRELIRDSISTLTRRRTQALTRVSPSSSQSVHSYPEENESVCFCLMYMINISIGRGIPCADEGYVQSRCQWCAKKRYDTTFPTTVRFLNFPSLSMIMYQSMWPRDPPLWQETPVLVKRAYGSLQQRLLSKPAEHVTLPSP